MDEGDEVVVVQSNRFGPVEVETSRTVLFPRGLYGFERFTDWAFFSVEQSERDMVYWMQSMQDPALAFVVCAAVAADPDFGVPLTEQDRRTLGTVRNADVAVMLICDTRDGGVVATTIGPLLVDVRTRVGVQVAAGPWNGKSDIPMPGVEFDGGE